MEARTGTGWNLPDRLNMAQQALSGPADQLAIIDLSGATRRDLRRADLREMTDGLARRLRRDVAPGRSGDGARQILLGQLAERASL